MVWRLTEEVWKDFCAESVNSVWLVESRVSVWYLFPFLLKQIALF